MNKPSKKPSLSIITAVYQGQEFIAACMDSVIQQGYASVEHIIVDGGSTDDTVKIVMSYQQKYPHIHFISEKDKGQSEALNKGIRMAQSNVIGILNVDDYYEPNVFIRMDKYINSIKEPAFVVGNCNLRGPSNEIVSVNKPQRLKQTDLLLGWGVNQTPINPSAYFYHRSLHDIVGYYNEADHYSMDVEFILRAVAAAHVLYVDESWGNFRYVPGTKTYEDVKSGGNKQRISLLLESFISKLPLYKRCWVRFLKYRKVSYFYYRIGYYLEDPIPRVRNTLQKYLRF